MLILQRQVDLVDIFQHFFGAETVLGRGDKDRWQFLPCLQENLLVCVHVHLDLAVAQFVGFCEDDGEGHFVLSAPLHKLKVDLLRLEARIDEYEERDELLAIEAVALDHLTERVALCLPRARKTIARQVHQMPLLRLTVGRDEEMIDGERLARFLGCLGQTIVMREHVDERRLSHIASPDKGVLRHRVLRTLLYVRRRDDILRLMDVHVIRNRKMVFCLVLL